MVDIVRTVKDQAKKSLARLGVLNPFSDLFAEIEFETTSYCNRKCDYCPNAEWERMGGSSGFFMAEDVFVTLVQQLKELGFTGKVAPHLYGEPMRDPRLTRWMAYVRKELPDSYIKVVTNGDYLDDKSYQRLIDAGVNIFFVSKHGAKLAAKAKKFLDNLDPVEKKKRIVLNDFWSDFNDNQTMLTNRGGDVSLRIKKRPPICCVYATYPVINSFGDVILCCQDFHSQYIFGNIMERHLGDIWNDPNNLNLRKRIYQGYFDLDICRHCEM